MIGYRRSSEMIRYMPAGHASKLTKILQASTQRNFKLDKEKAPMAQPAITFNKTSGRKHYEQERRLYSRTPDDEHSTWAHGGNWTFQKARAIFILGWRSTIATTSHTKNREPRWPPYQTLRRISNIYRSTRQTLCREKNDKNSRTEMPLI